MCYCQFAPKNFKTSFQIDSPRKVVLIMYVLYLGLKRFAQRSMSKLTVYNGDKIYNL